MEHGRIITPRDLEGILCDETADPKALPFSLLEEITNCFSDQQKIGSGGFAVVYKGMLENKAVAVKRISNAFMHEKEFHQEVECLMMVKHKNVVRFLGYCADTQGSMERYNGKFIMADVHQRLLCFEYHPKGSLDKYITDIPRRLRWRDCFHIIKGICHGLHYLHQKNIVHLDLKPANILLDDNWVPKITDFGISRCFDEMQSRVITKIAGTLGYLAPESFNHREVTYRHSYRLDIYSLGVVIMEILTGEKGYHDIDNVLESWSKSLEKSQREIQQEQVRVCAEIGIECTNFNPSKRPDMHHIISRLDETESMDGYIETGTVNSQQINPGMLIGSMHAIWLAYKQLNPDIRRCIEYCNIFPKGSKLRMVELIRMWIAQGFVKTNYETEDMEDIAEGYIQELVSISFLQPIGTSSDIDCFTVHDLLHDILDKVAGNFFRIENARSQGGEVWEGDVPQEVQHLFVQKYDAELILGLKNLLTLIVYVVETDTLIEEKVIESICKRLPKLRVLAVAFSQEHRAIMEPHEFSIPESICQLKHLRYFSFRTMASCTLILPRALNKLPHVQLLDFGDGNIVEFNFGDHINLRHISCTQYVKFCNIGRLTTLQMIPKFGVRNEQGYELKQLRDLNNLCGSLEIYSLENVESKEEALEANLAAKERLTELTLRWDFSSRSCSPEVQAEVLDGLYLPVGLYTLIVSGYEGSRYPEWMVGKQNGGPKDLQELEFYYCSQPGPAPELVEAFPHLRLLWLSSCSWVALPSNMEHLRSLKALMIDSCLNIWTLPTLPQSLEQFHLIHCDDELTESCQTVGHTNWQKIEYIPHKIFDNRAFSDEYSNDSDDIASHDSDDFHDIASQDSDDSRPRKMVKL